MDNVRDENDNIYVYGDLSVVDLWDNKHYS